MSSRSLTVGHPDAGGKGDTEPRTLANMPGRKSRNADAEARSAPVFESSYGRGVKVWFSPWDQPVALRYERDDENAPWAITGFLAVSRSPQGLGSGWMKNFKWLGLGSPYLSRGAVWKGEPTLQILDEVYDENGLLRKQTDMHRTLYADQIDPVTNVWEALGPVQSPSRSQALDHARELTDRLKAEDADEATIREAEKDFFYRRVAAVYSEASSEGRSPVVAVAEEWNAPTTSASNWVRESRVRGYLPPTQRGRAT